MNASFVYSLLLFYGILVVVNIPAPFLGLEFKSDRTQRLWYQPPGFVIPIVWFVLFTLLALSRNILLQSGKTNLQGWLFALAALCALYYTLGLAKLTGISALWFGLAGNLAVIIFAAVVFFKLLPFSTPAAWLAFPVIVWTLYATLLVIGEMKLEKLV
jgi:tryptophan-rich sensory protein